MTRLFLENEGNGASADVINTFPMGNVFRWKQQV